MQKKRKETSIGIYFCARRAVASFVPFALALCAPLVQAQVSVTQDMVLTGDINEPLEIYASGITVDCQNFSVIEQFPVDQESPDYPSPTRAGILIVGVSDVTIQNCNVVDFWFGIQVNSSTSVNLIGNTVIESSQPSMGWTVRDAFSILGSTGTVLIGNTEADTEADGFVLVNSRESLLVGNSAGGGGNAYGLDTADDNQLQNNTVTGTNGGDGFDIHASNGNQLVANNVSGQNNGFRVWDGSSNNTIRANAIEGNAAGILVCPGLVDANVLGPNRFRDNGGDVVATAAAGGCD